MPGQKILIVEDEASIRNLCVAVLCNRGFDSIIAHDGLEGLEAYRERRQEICLVLSDIVMPIMDGIEMVRHMFEFDSHANVILMSGSHLSKLIPDEVRKLCAILEKPFTAARLLEVVEKCIEHDLEQHPSTANHLI